MLTLILRFNQASVNLSDEALGLATGNFVFHYAYMIQQAGWQAIRSIGKNHVKMSKLHTE